jgi:hypothetical protein
MKPLNNITLIVGKWEITENTVRGNSTSSYSTVHLRSHLPSHHVE